MALHDYGCVEDGTILPDQYRPITEGASLHPPLCPTCGNQMAWMPRARFDLRSDGSAAFGKFTTYDGRNQLVEIDSLHKLRQVERESEQAARDGEGQQMVFRAYANDRGNRLESTLGTMPSERPTAEGKRKFGRQGAMKTTAAEPDRAYGPGVSDANTSALKDQ